MIDEIYEDDIKQLQYNYYLNYYKNTLKLKDFETRINNRFDEEAIEYKRLQLIINDYLNISDIKSKKVLVIGLGTGSVLYGLKQLGFHEIYGIEPNLEALEISKLKAKKLNLEVLNLLDSVAEKLPYEDNFFDFIFTYTVFEHISDVEKGFDELIRSLKFGGSAYLSFPNYNYPYEDHYKIPALTFLGKSITKIFAYLLRKDSKFIDTLNFLTIYSVDRILKKYQNIVYFRVNHPYPQVNKSSKIYKNIYHGFFKFFYKRLNMNKNQEIIIKKK